MAAARTLRDLDEQASITLVGNEPAYARMVLPYYIEGRIEERAVFTADATHFETLKIDARLDTRVSAVDTSARRIELEGGESIEFDTLLLATGSRSARAPIPGAEGDSALDLWTLQDAKNFLAAPHGEVVIVGAGFIAFTVLDAVMHRAERVHVVEVEPQILPNMLDETATELMTAHLRDRGLSIHTGTRVDRLETTGDRRILHLSNGETLSADAVVLATGVRPNLDFLEGSGIETDIGVLVDGLLQTNVEGIFAAGDCAQGPVLHLNERRVHAIQPTAVDHGRLAAANMAGQNATFEGSLIMNILATQAFEAASFGLWGSDELETTRVENTAGRIYRRYVWDGDRLVGGILVGPTHALSGQNDVGMLKGLIQTGVALGPWRSYLEENPLDLRRVFVASGAAKRLLDSTLLSGRMTEGGAFRIGAQKAMRTRSEHHTTLLTGAP